MDYPREAVHSRRAAAARAALHEPRPARLLRRQPARGHQGRAVRALLALRRDAAPPVPGRVRGGGRADGRVSGEVGQRACRAPLRAGLPGVRRRLRRAARRRAPRLRVGLERAHQDPPARPARRLPRAVDALHRLRPRAAERALPLLPGRAARARRTREAMEQHLRPLLRGPRRACGRGRPSSSRAATSRRRSGSARSRRRRSTRCAGLLPAASLSHVGIYAQRPGLRAAGDAAAGLAAARRRATSASWR